MKVSNYLKSIIFSLLVMAVLVPNISGNIFSYQTSSLNFMNQSSGPMFDLTLMPDYIDLIPSTEPVNLTLELRVGVSDPDGVSTVIGSYKNNSGGVWTNVTMSQDISTGDPEDYVDLPFNYTMSEPSFVIIWDIQFYANDSLDNWNTSSVVQISISRQSTTESATTTITGNSTSTTTNTGDPNLSNIPFIVTMGSIILVIVVLFIIYRKRV